MERFKVIKQLGQGSFSTIFEAQDLKQNMRKVAIKVEKEDKSKKVLQFEYSVLLNIQHLKHVCKVYDFVTNPNPTQANCIVMQLMGKNLANHKKSMKRRWTRALAVNILLQMLEAIQQLHDEGYIHRDVKPSNFVVGLYSKKNDVFMVDFGLAKQHLDKNGVPHEMRKNTDFRGTITYASLNAHNKIDLSRRDDMWSFYFVILDFLNEELPWRTCKFTPQSASIKDEVRNIKTRVFKDPENLLWRGPTRTLYPVKSIFHHLNSLNFEDRPDYDYVRSCLTSLLDEPVESCASSSTVASLQFVQSPLAPPTPIDETPKILEGLLEYQTPSFFQPFTPLKSTTYSGYLNPMNPPLPSPSQLIPPEENYPDQAAFNNFMQNFFPWNFMVPQSPAGQDKPYLDLFQFNELPAYLNSPLTSGLPSTAMPPCPLFSTPPLDEKQLAPEPAPFQHDCNRGVQFATPPPPLTPPPQSSLLEPRKQAADEVVTPVKQAGPKRKKTKHEVFKITRHKVTINKAQLEGVL